MERLICCGNVKTKSAAQSEAYALGIGFEKLDRAVFAPEKAYDKVAALGVKWVRLQSGWARCEKEPGVYDFTWLDAIVNRFLSLSMKPWLNLSYGNPLYNEKAKKVFGAVGCPPINSEAETSAWLAYVSALVSHFRGRIEYYEIWNEPDLKYSWKHEVEGDDPGPNGTEYGQFCRKTALAIRKAAPTTKILGFALANTNNADFVKAAMDCGLSEVLDGISFHSYSVDDFNRIRRIDTLRALCDSYGKKLEIIQGETGAQSRSDGCGAMHRFAWTPARQTKHLLRNTLADLAAGCKFSSYFSTVDMIEALNGLVGDKSTYLDYGYFGVLGADFNEDGVATGEYRPKPSYFALQTLASLFSEPWEHCTLPVLPDPHPSPRINGTDCTDPSLITLGFRKTNGATALAYWNSVPLLTTTYEGTVSFRTPFAYEKIRIVDCATGKIYCLPPQMTEKLPDGGLLLKNLPITDSPLMLTFGDFAQEAKSP